MPGSVLTSASWIWTAEPTTGNVAFLRSFSSLPGKTATSATISMTAVGQFTLFVNGQPIGASGNGTDDWMSVQVLSAALNASTNTFAVLAVNNLVSGGPPPGFLAAIQVQYSNGSPDIVVSDASWGVSAIIPPAFPTVSPSDAAHFASATIAGPFGSASWGTNVTIPVVPSTSPSSILPESTWIWNIASAASDAPATTVGFRKSVDALSLGKSAQSAQIIIAADNGFMLYVNDQYIGAPPPAPIFPDFRRAQRFTVDLLPASNNITIFGQNIPGDGSTGAGPAGLAATVTIQYSDGSSSLVATDANWLSGNFPTVPAFLAMDDSLLSPAFALGTMGAEPWGQLSGISDVLAASKVPTGPFPSGSVPPAPPGGQGNTTASNASSTAAPLALIIGPVAGGIVLLAAALVLLFWCCRRQRRSRSLNSEPFNVENTHVGRSSEYVTSSFYGPPVRHADSDIGSMQSQSVTSYPFPNSWPAAVVQPQGVSLPPSKLERERMWLSNGAAAGSDDDPNPLAPPNYYDYAR
ncbi:hypothetical protein B0H19DRAFT_1131855 [Mycena capillaripes]|nr:hypothetical protein B0H19DRAFT_1131855 [Mycena capillaripes]